MFVTHFVVGAICYQVRGRFSRRLDPRPGPRCFLVPDRGRAPSGIALEP